LRRAWSDSTPGTEGTDVADIVYFDLETQKSAEEVGGWHHADRMLMSVGITYSTAEGSFRVHREEDAPALAEHLAQADLVVGFNVVGFDYKVLQPYTQIQLARLPTLDLLADLHQRLGHRVSLDSCVEATLGEHKSADGLTALRWWKEGRVDEIIEYCKKDVEVTRRLHEHGCQHGHVFFMSRYKGRTKAAVSWSLDPGRPT